MAFYRLQLKACSILSSRGVSHAQKPNAQKPKKPKKLNSPELGLGKGELAKQSGAIILGSRPLPLKPKQIQNDSFKTSRYTAPKQNLVNIWLFQRTFVTKMLFKRTFVLNGKIKMVPIPVYAICLTTPIVLYFFFWLRDISCYSLVQELRLLIFDLEA